MDSRLGLTPHPTGGERMEQQLDLNDVKLMLGDRDIVIYQQAKYIQKLQEEIKSREPKSIA